MDCLQKCLSRFKTNKNFTIIVNLCFNILRYVLFESDKHEFINLKANYDEDEGLDNKSIKSNNRSNASKSRILAYSNNDVLSDGKSVKSVKRRLGSRARNSVVNSATKTPTKKMGSFKSPLCNKNSQLNINSQREVAPQMPSFRYSNSPIPEKCAEEIL